MKRFWKTWRALLLGGMAALMLLTPALGVAAERVVLGEEFTATW